MVEANPHADNDPPDVMTLGGGVAASRATRDMVAEVEFSGAPIKVYPKIGTPMPTQEIISHPENRQVFNLKNYHPHLL